MAHSFVMCLDVVIFCSTMDVGMLVRYLGLFSFFADSFCSSSDPFSVLRPFSNVCLPIFDIFSGCFWLQSIFCIYGSASPLSPLCCYVDCSGACDPCAIDDKSMTMWPWLFMPFFASTKQIWENWPWNGFIRATSAAHFTSLGPQQKKPKVGSSRKDWRALRALQLATFHSTNKQILIMITMQSAKMLDFCCFFCAALHSGIFSRHKTSNNANKLVRPRCERTRQKKMMESTAAAAAAKKGIWHEKWDNEIRPIVSICCRRSLLHTWVVCARNSVCLIYVRMANVNDGEAKKRESVCKTSPNGSDCDPKVSAKINICSLSMSIRMQFGQRCTRCAGSRFRR